MRDKIKTIIWDLDNTLYKFNDGLLDGWSYAAAKYTSDNHDDLDYKTAVQMALDGWKNHRNSGYHFVNDFGFDQRKIINAVDEALDVNHVIPCPQTPNLMENMRDYHHVILTLAIKDWAYRVLDHTGLAEFFHPDFILGAEDYNFEDKAHSPRGILTALDKIGGNANEVLFVEDTLPNLKTAKDHTDVNTAYLHHNRTINDNDMAHVDISVQDTPELLKWFKEIPAA